MAIPSKSNLLCNSSIKIKKVDSDDYIALEIKDVGDLPVPPDNVHSLINKSPFYAVLHGAKDYLLPSATYLCVLPNGDECYLFIQSDQELDEVYSYYVCVN